MLPSKEVIRVLERAYPCAGFEDACRTMQWDLQSGFIPRGYIGATNTVSDVEVVFVLSEPGEPQGDENYSSEMSAIELIKMTCRQTYVCLMDQRDQYHSNLRFILDQFFPSVDLDLQLKRCWITQSVLCSAPVETGILPVEVSRECRVQYLERQLQLFPNARVVALGSAAQSRLRAYASLLVAGHPAPPGCNHRGVREGWVSIARQFRGAF